MTRKTKAEKEAEEQAEQAEQAADLQARADAQEEKEQAEAKALELEAQQDQEKPEPQQHGSPEQEAASVEIKPVLLWWPDWLGQVGFHEQGEVRHIDPPEDKSKPVKVHPAAVKYLVSAGCTRA